MNLSNPDLWVLRYIQSFTGDAVRGLDIPIPVFDTPDLSDRFIRVRITNSVAQSNWKFAGTAKQIVNTGGVESIAKQFSFDLNDPTLLNLPDFEVYKLRVRFPRYFKQGTISIFGYLGTLSDPSAPFVLSL